MSVRRHRLHRKMKGGRSLIFAGDDLCAIEQGFDIAAFEKPRLVPAVDRRFKRGVDRIIANECSSDGKDRIQQVQRLVRRLEEHTSELQSLMRISYAVFCLKKQKNVYTTL